MKLIYTIVLFLLTQPILGNTFFPKWSTEADLWFMKNKIWQINGVRDNGFTADGRKIGYSKGNKVEIVNIRNKKLVRVFDFSLIENGRWRYF